MYVYFARIKVYLGESTWPNHLFIFYSLIYLEHVYKEPTCGSDTFLNPGGREKYTQLLLSIYWESKGKDRRIDLKR